MQEAILIDPFAPLHADPLEVVIPEGCTDVYHWVAYLANGQRFAEYDAKDPAGSWHDIEIGRVTFIDLLPIRHSCPDHEQLRGDCARCQFAFRTRTLHPHRLRVPDGGRAYFERRRELVNNEVIRTFTVLGWERHFLSVKPIGKNVPKLVDLGERNVKVGSFFFLDDYGRVYMTSELEEF